MLFEGFSVPPNYASSPLFKIDKWASRYRIEKVDISFIHQGKFFVLLRFSQKILEIKLKLISETHQFMLTQCTSKKGTRQRKQSSELHTAKYPPLFTRLPPSPDDQARAENDHRPLEGADAKPPAIGVAHNLVGVGVTYLLVLVSTHSFGLLYSVLSGYTLSLSWVRTLKS